MKKLGVKENTTLCEINELPVIINGQDIDDIMAAALDGPYTAYWCNQAEVIGKYLGEYASDQISRGGTLKFHSRYNDFLPIELTLDKFVYGLRKYIARTQNMLSEYNETYTTIYTLNWNQMDAVQADIIIQTALFGEYVYS